MTGYKGHKKIEEMLRRGLAVLMAAILCVGAVPAVTSSAAGLTEDGTDVTDAAGLRSESDAAAERSGAEDEWDADELRDVMEMMRTAREELAELTARKSVLALVYLCDTYPVRAEASHDSEIVLNVPGGQSVLIEDVALALEEDGYGVWAYVSLYDHDREYRGYVPREYLACSDERFLAWEETYGMNPGMMLADDVLANAEMEQFPASYREPLRKLKEQHPNWQFVAMNTQLDWNTVIANEIGDAKNLIEKSYGDHTKEGLDGGNWYYVSEDALKYFMDPRNFLEENTVFQFEQLTYNESVHTKEALDQFLNSTFMNDSQNAPGTDMTFSTILWAVGVAEDSGVSPYHLAARVRQEQGLGTSPLISGNYPGYEGLYNYFNVGATGKSETECIVSGLQHARKEGWTSAYWSILGGADVISSNYIKRGQDTLYLQKFNVTTNGTYWHQYMQNVSAAYSEGKSTYGIYRNAGALDSPFVFRIPVYRNMPENNCAMPTFSTNVVLQIPEGYDTTVWLDGVPYAPAVRNGRFIVKAPDGQAGNAVVYRYNENGVPVGMYLWTLEYRNNAYVATEQPQLVDLLTYHGFSIRITGKSGIRFKTGISADLRNALTSEGVNGYVLKEYGTLVMRNVYNGQYPMIKGGEKVQSGTAYGFNESGAWVDKIYETVDGRHRFTSVFVGLPVSEYRVEYAFRGYAVLEKDGVETIVYGPRMAKSIYALAEQVLNMGLYPQGSDADAFLRQIIADAQ